MPMKTGIIRTYSRKKGRQHFDSSSGNFSISNRDPFDNLLTAGR